MDLRLGLGWHIVQYEHQTLQRIRKKLYAFFKQFSPFPPTVLWILNDSAQAESNGFKPSGFTLKLAFHLKGKQKTIISFHNKYLALGKKN